MFRRAFAFRTRHQPYMVRANCRREMRSALTWREVSVRPARAEAARTKPIVNNTRWRPPADHPFRRGLGAGVKD